MQMISHGIRGFSLEELEILTEFFTVVRATPGTVVFAEGSEADFFVVVLHGRGAFSSEEHHNRTLPLHTAMTGTSYPSVLINRKRVSTPHACRPCACGVPQVLKSTTCFV